VDKKGNEALKYIPIKIDQIATITVVCGQITNGTTKTSSNIKYSCILTPITKTVDF